MEGMEDEMRVFLFEVFLSSRGWQPCWEDVILFACVWSVFNLFKAVPAADEFVNDTHERVKFFLAPERGANLCVLLNASGLFVKIINGERGGGKETERNEKITKQIFFGVQFALRRWGDWKYVEIEKQNKQADVNGMMEVFTR